MKRLPVVPTMPCECVDRARKDAIAKTRTVVVDAMWSGNPPKSDREWRDLMLDIVNILKGL